MTLINTLYTQAALYSVRWYFEQEEFYRYVPKESPPSRVFPISGVIVDVSVMVIPFPILILISKTENFFFEFLFCGSLR